MPIQTNGAHQDAVGRRRRIISQYDAIAACLDMGETEWPQWAFEYLDEDGAQVDSIFWDCGLGNRAVVPSDVVPPDRSAKVRQYIERGVDWCEIYVEESHRRGMEAFWNHRIAEVDMGEHHGEMDATNEIKAAHPGWVIKTWWWQGLWNLASPGLREFKVRQLREMAERYAFDGFQIDFARHVPVLPVGRQWELRDEATQFMRMLREMLLEVAAERGTPILLSAKVPRSLAGCRCDGFDVEAWVREGLVDMLTLGSRSFDVEVSAFRETLGDHVKLYPCIDDYHASDGYRSAPVEVFRGVAASWYAQGADGVATFNWDCASPRRDEWPYKVSQHAAYQELGSQATLSGEDKVFPVERQGGYKWSEGYFNQNADAQLPLKPRYDGTPSTVTVPCADERPEGVWKLYVTYFNAEPGDVIRARLNGRDLDEGQYDHDWKDAQICSPQPQHTSGGLGNYEVNPEQKLLRVCHHVEAQDVLAGRNTVELSVVKQAPHCCREIQVEKVELHVTY